MNKHLISYLITLSISKDLRYITYYPLLQQSNYFKKEKQADKLRI